MRTNLVAACAVVGLAWLTSAADDAIVVGTNSGEVSANTWKDIASSPTNITTSSFTGFDISKAYPSSEQEGWELSIGVKENVKLSSENITATVMSISRPSNGDVDSSWHFCVYTFNVRSISSYAYYAGQKDSCNNLVAPECIDDLKKIAVKNSATDSCNAYSSTASCLRDLDEQSAMTLSVSAENALGAFRKNSTFFRRVDSGEKAFQTAASQPMLVVTVFGSSAQSGKAPTPEVACVLPNAKTKTSGASNIACFMGWAAAALPVALQLALY